MNISSPFIARPVATALLMVGLLLGGLAAPRRVLAERELPNAPGHRAAAGRRSANNGVFGRNTKGHGTFGARLR